MKLKLFRNCSGYYLSEIWNNLLCILLIIDLSLKQVLHKVKYNSFSEKKGIERNLFSPIPMAFVYFRRMIKNNLYLKKVIKMQLAPFLYEERKEIAFYGRSDIVRLVLRFGGKVFKLKTKGIYEDSVMVGQKFCGQRIFPLDSLREYKGLVIISRLGDTRLEERKLCGIGIPKENIITFN